MMAWLFLVAVLTGSSGQDGASQAGRTIERVACASDPAETYTVYLPSQYGTPREWPLLLVFDPRGKGASAAAIFRDAAEAFGWIVVSSDNTRSDGPWEPNRRALAALWPEVLRTYSVDRRRVYAAGFSGGATVAWVLARSSGGVSGIIASGAPAPQDATATPGNVAWFGSAGRADFNFLGARELDARIARTGVPHRLEFFDGPHQWLTPDLARVALGWLEMLAMKDGRRPRDGALAARVVAEEIARAQRLESAGRIVDARRTLASILDSYAGLADVGDAARRASEIDRDERLARARKNEQRADDRERALRAAARPVLARLGADELPYAGSLAGELKFSALQKAAARGGYDGESARRVLESLFVQTSFYLPREFEDKQEYARAALSLELATAIHPDRPLPWVNLAGARAKSGSRKPAIAALARAIELGFRDTNALAGDERFAPLRGMAEYARLLETLAGR